MQPAPHDIYRRPHTVVLGAGVAGLVAAYELSRRGHVITLVEASERLGGRASSWQTDCGDADPGLHVVARHYRNLRAILADVGSLNRLVWLDSHLFLRPQHSPEVWRFSPLPQPFHLAGPGIRMKLPIRDRVAFSKAAAAVWRRSQSELLDFDSMTFSEWCQRYRLEAGLLADIGKASSDAATFLSPERASAYSVLSWMRYMSRDARAGDVGLFTCSHEKAIAAPLRDAIEGLGGHVLLSTVAIGIDSEGDAVRGVRVAAAGGPVTDHVEPGVLPFRKGTERLVPCDFLVAALPARRLRQLLSKDQTSTAGLGTLPSLSSASAMSLVLRFDQVIRPAPPGVPLVCSHFVRDFVDLSTFRHLEEDRSVYQVVLSETSELEAMDDNAVVRLVTDELELLWPAIRAANLLSYDVHRVVDAMVAALPGTHRARPGQTTGYRNLFLAGDWTRHYFNASMEGAAYSGRRAAEGVLEAADGMREHIAIPPQ